MLAELLLQFLLISMILKDKLLKMLVKLLVLMYKELLTNQQQLPYLMECKKNKIKSLQFMI
jgi:hypothetical protein